MRKLIPDEDKPEGDGRKGILGQGQFGVPFRLNPVYMGELLDESHLRSVEGR